MGFCQVPWGLPVFAAAHCAHAPGVRSLRSYVPPQPLAFLLAPGLAHRSFNPPAKQYRDFRNRRNVGYCGTRRVRGGGWPIALKSRRISGFEGLIPSCCCPAGFCQVPWGSAAARWARYIPPANQYRAFRSRRNSGYCGMAKVDERSEIQKREE